MKLIRIGGLALLAAAVSLGAWAATKAWAAHCGGSTTISCTENVSETKHNLAANVDIRSSGTTEVCVFCHTPHGGRTDVAGGGAPLWNRAIPPNTGFSNYDSPNFDDDRGGEVAGPKGVSLACLSCHDGTIALDALINAPGSGGFNSANKGTVTRPGSSLDSISFAGPGIDTTDETLAGDETSTRPSTTAGGGFLGGRNDFVYPAGAPLGSSMAPFPNLTTDLTNDHPISVRMPSADPQFKDALDNSPAADRNIRAVARLGKVVPTDKRDRVRLYNTGGTAGTTVDWVECASCHNPHTPRTTFLRLPSLASAATGSETPAYTAGVPVPTRDYDLNHEPNQGSLICLTCHQK